jgi:hypothetical protein
MPEYLSERVGGGGNDESDGIATFDQVAWVR